MPSLDDLDLDFGAVHCLPKPDVYMDRSDVTSAKQHGVIG